jgi:hypothetical protein
LYIFKINKGFKIALAIAIIFFYFFISCNSSGSKPKIYRSPQGSWSSVSVSKFIGDINYTATEVPLQYYLLKANKNNLQSVDSLFHLYAKERIIEIEFEHTNKDDLLLSDYTKRSYEDAVKYMAFTIEKDFLVVTSTNDTIACVGVNFERNFKLAPFKRVLLYFDNVPPEDSIKLIYQDHLFGNGIIKFNFKNKPVEL